MHRTAIAEKMRTELHEHALDLYQHSPKALGVFTVITRVAVILIERDAVADLVRRSVNLHSIIEVGELREQFPIKLGNSVRPQRDPTFGAVAGRYHQPMRDEIEVDLKCAVILRHGQGG